MGNMKLTGTDRQADRQTGGRAGKPVYWEAAPPKILSALQFIRGHEKARVKAKPC